MEGNLMGIDLNKMPKLGFGLMRLPEKDGEPDMPQVCKMVDFYMEKGFNYFDTAYVYHGGKSEVVVREAIVKRYPRDSFYIATKLPAWELKKAEDCDRIFREQLERTGVDYFDFYLLHSIEEGNNYDTYIKYNCFDWAMEKKKKGQIKHFGFSFHGSPALLEKILSEHPEVEFVQIQLNYADWKSPIVHSGKLYNILREHNIPIIVMEPVKGGMLAGTTPELEAMMKKVQPNKSIASWAFRFVGSLDGIMTILSGMSNEEQHKDNIETFTNFEPLSDKEREILDEVTKAMAKSSVIQCTSCRYCCDGCPQKISIPDVISALNTLRLYGDDARPHFFYGNLVDKSGRAGDCISCGQCEKVCPQHLPIIDIMKEASKIFDK
ncbi:MAG: Fe-S oxidoreductase [Clostridium sp.]|nr:Fe-S oxidoreductase [Clostridium sp.]